MLGRFVLPVYFTASVAVVLTFCPKDWAKPHDSRRAASKKADEKGGAKAQQNRRHGILACDVFAKARDTPFAAEPASGILCLMLVGEVGDGREHGTDTGNLRLAIRRLASSACSIWSILGNVG